jgi:hypothetical protein
MQTAMAPEKTATTVIEVDPRADRRWDEFVRARADASVFHLSDWAEILRRAYGYRARYLALDGPDGIEGVLPLYMTRGLMSRKRLRFPAVNAAGPLASDEAGLAALLEAAASMTEREARLITLQSRRPGLDALEPRFTAIPKSPTWIAPVPAPEDVDLKRWKKHSRNLYRGVNRALESGLTWREARGQDDLRRWYGLYLATMRKRRTLPRSWALMENTRRLLEPRGEFRLFVVEHEGRMLAGVVTYPFNGVVDMMFNGSDPDELELRPNHLLNWGVLGWAARNGYSQLDIGDAADGGPLSRFKMQFGAERVEDYRYDYVINSAPRLEKARTTGNNFEAVDSETLAARAWARVPLPALRAAGTAIYRFL